MSADNAMAGQEASRKTLKVLRALLPHFANGLAPGQIAEACQMNASTVTRHVGALIDEGFAERIPETGRIRPSHSLGRAAVSILASLDQAEQRIRESRARLGGG